MLRLSPRDLCVRTIPLTVFSHRAYQIDTRYPGFTRPLHPSLAECLNLQLAQTHTSQSSRRSRTAVMGNFTRENTGIEVVEAYKGNVKGKTGTYYAFVPSQCSVFFTGSLSLGHRSFPRVSFCVSELVFSLPVLLYSLPGPLFHSYHPQPLYSSNPPLLLFPPTHPPALSSSLPAFSSS